MAFDGIATYDIFSNEIGQDVSPLVAVAAWLSAPFLASIGMGDMAFEGPVITWQDKFMLPETYSVSSGIASSAATSYGLEVGANASLSNATIIPPSTTFKKQTR